MHLRILKLPLLLNLLSDVSSFSSALKRMTNVSVPNHSGGRVFTPVKGALGTIERLLASIPDGYDETCKWLTRRGSLVLALRLKEMDAIHIK